MLTMNFPNYFIFFFILIFFSFVFVFNNNKFKNKNSSASQTFFVNINDGDLCPSVLFFNAKKLQKNVWEDTVMVILNTVFYFLFCET